MRADIRVKGREGLEAGGEQVGGKQRVNGVAMEKRNRDDIREERS